MKYFRYFPERIIDPDGVTHIQTGSWSKGSGEYGYVALCKYIRGGQSTSNICAVTCLECLAEAE